ncbi:hypothetical protein [Neolewinella antarctica]|uniref:Uncharacterized protein n=1 Tax=Neolewinella antarctica TaxID=442734 RepID=A0ABX0XEW3_9BACT|nr:hypothetical protein [Neolewinella antarctica]NJC27865.1 hypothetical protein [Neolewinella antarctica]
MNNLRYICLFALFLAPYFGGFFAQSADEVVLINFDGEQLDLSDSPYHITEIISIQTDARSPIGIAYRGHNSTPHYIRLEGSQEKALASLLNKATQDDQLPQAILRVTGLAANQQISFMSTRINLALEAELLLPTTEGGYLVYGPVRKVRRESAGYVKRSVPGKLTELLDQVIASLVQLPGAGGVARKISGAEANSPPEIYPVQQLAGSEIPDGIYESFLDFRAGRPSTLVTVAPGTPELIYIDEERKKYHKVLFSRPDEINKRAFREIWGVQQGGHSYFRLPDGSFYQLQRTPENDFLVSIPNGLVLMKYDASVAEATFYYGLTGGLLVANLKYPYGGEISTFRYNLAAGQFEPAHPELSSAPAARLLVTNSRFSKKKHQLLIQKENGLSTLLIPAGITEVPASDTICFRIGEEDVSCEPVPPAGSLSGHQLGKIVVLGSDRYRIDWLAGPEIDAMLDISDPD